MLEPLTEQWFRHKTNTTIALQAEPLYQPCYVLSHRDFIYMKTFTGVSCRDMLDNKQHAKFLFDVKLFVYAARRERWSKHQVPEEHDLLLKHPNHETSVVRASFILLKSKK